MLDKNFVRENLEFVKERLAARGGSYPLDELMSANEEWKNVILRLEELRRRRNEESESIGKLKRAGQDTTELQAKVKEVTAETKSLEERAATAEERLNSLLHGIPNLPHA